MRILAIVKPNSGCDYHRVSLPFSYMEFKQGDSFRFFSDNEVLQDEEFSSFDIVYFNRTPNFEFDKLLELRSKYGFKIVCDLDDYWSLNANHTFYKHWQDTKMRDQIIKSLIKADLCIVTNEQLKGQVDYLTNICVVIPNALPFGYGQFNMDHKESNKINIIYAGGSSHFPDLESVANLFTKLGSDGEFKKKAKITLAGFTSDTIKNTGNWIKMENIVKRCGSYSRKYSLPLHNYMDHYNDADMSISPLENNSFNNFKSNLKVIEAGCKAIPIIVPNMQTYQQDISMKDKGVFFCNTVSDWYKTIKKLIQNKNMVEDAGEQLQEYVMSNYDLIKWNKERYYQLQKLL
jgi:hypothetical protein